jgi:histone deacetylase complex regulatory component SIN3
MSPETLSVNDALRYLDQVRAALYDQPDTHRRFLMIFKDFRDTV